MNYQAELVAKALAEIADKNGGVLQPEAVVQEATPNDHPLHGHFNWNDAEAAHAHRLNQARTLIRSVKVEVKTINRTIETVYYVKHPHLTTHRDGGYISIPHLRTRAELAGDMLQNEFARVLSILGRVRDLATVLGLEKNIEELMEKVKVTSSIVAPTVADEIEEEEVATAVAS